MKYLCTNNHIIKLNQYMKYFIVNIQHIFNVIKSFIISIMHNFKQFCVND